MKGNLNSLLLYASYMLHVLSKVLDDGEEVEVRTQTHTENWNGNPNKYVPDRRVEVRQLDQIRNTSN